MLSDPQLHYLDNAATSRVDPAVAQAVSEALTELWANPSSLYDPAVAAQDAIAAARARVAKTLHCRSDEIYFTACGSEGNNMAVTGAARPRKHWGNKIVVTGFEHPSVQRPIRALKDEGFTVVEVMPGADGRIDTQKFLAEIDKNTVLAACMAVNNETGAVQDIAALGKGIKARNSRTHFHVDAVQAWLRMPIDLQNGARSIRSPSPATRSTRLRASAHCSSGTASARRSNRPISAAIRSAACAPAPRTRPTLWVSAWPPRRASRSCAPALHTLPR